MGKNIGLLATQISAKGLKRTVVFINKENQVGTETINETNNNTIFNVGKTLSWKGRIITLTEEKT